MDSEFVRDVLKKLKSKKGCSLDDFDTLLPNLAEVGDAPPPYYLGDDLQQLIRYGLIEAYKDRKLVKLDEFNSNDAHSYTYFLAPPAIILEDLLDISLTASPIFGKPRRSKSWPELFMLMPFSMKLRPVFDEHVKKVASDLGITAARADDFFSRGSIMKDVWSAIYHAKVIVADCTKRNPNVFYEIGIAHTLGKDTILISQALKDIPFDLRDYHVILYDLTPEGRAKFDSQLKATLKTVL